MIRLRVFQLALTGNGRELVAFGSSKCLKGSPGRADQRRLGGGGPGIGRHRQADQPALPDEDR